MSNQNDFPWWVYALGAVMVALLLGWLNARVERDCRGRGGQVIERWGQVNGCLRPTRDR